MNKKDFVEMINSWYQVSNEFAQLYPCATCLNVKYSYDGKNLIKICNTSCHLIKQYEDTYQKLQDLYLLKDHRGEL